MGKESKSGVGQIERRGSLGRDRVLSTGKRGQGQKEPSLRKVGSWSEGRCWSPTVHISLSPSRRRIGPVPHQDRPCP